MEATACNTDDEIHEAGESRCKKTVLISDPGGNRLAVQQSSETFFM